MALKLGITLLPASGEKKPFRPPGGGEVACSGRGRVLWERPFDEVTVLSNGINVGVAGSERGSRGSVHAKARGRRSAE